jgi:hypothetical protein
MVEKNCDSRVMINDIARSHAKVHALNGGQCEKKKLSGEV